MMKRFFFLLALTLLLGACAVSRDAVSIEQRKSFWTGSPVLKVNLPFPEPLSFELPSADWRIFDVKGQEGRGSLIALGEGNADSYAKVRIEGQNPTLFESLEKDTGIDFSQPDSVVLAALFEHYRSMTLKENPEKDIQCEATRFEMKDGDVLAWMVTRNNSYSVAYAVLKTKNSNFFTIEVDQSHRITDIESVLLGIASSRDSF